MNRPTRHQRAAHDAKHLMAVVSLLLALSGCASTSFWFSERLQRDWGRLETADLNQLFASLGALRDADQQTLRERAANLEAHDPSELLGWGLVMADLGRPSDQIRAKTLFQEYLDQPDQTPGGTALASLMTKRLQSEVGLRQRLSLTIRQRDDLETRLRAIQKDQRGDSNLARLDAIEQERNELLAELERIRAHQGQARDRTLRATIRERDELNAQLEELKAIELEIRERKRQSELELPYDNSK
ncbi:hypothetical protein CKO25_09060 [Thiocapsa imhoffii]|uniref:Uncharacterized protein n=1 Tax=Thiocapsa imhoffii TaxID=382777 RepID=A0A9X1B982_9GAMM|nr:hypothetical protein [Thiocapsa imhoffii]MBK1644795.1 hypothetical protein [Thiocapsa imhoffii]